MSCSTASSLASNTTSHAYFTLRITCPPILNSPNPFRKCSQWPRGLRRRPVAARVLRLWVWIVLGSWMSVCCECCVLSRRGLVDELITRPEEFYRMWCVVACDLETLWMKRPWPTGGLSHKKQTKPLGTSLVSYSLPRNVNLGEFPWSVIYVASLFNRTTWIL
jgi:hypothetical protein